MLLYRTMSFRMVSQQLHTERLLNTGGYTTTFRRSLNKTFFSWPMVGREGRVQLRYGVYRMECANAVNEVWPADDRMHACVLSPAARVEECALEGASFSASHEVGVCHLALKSLRPLSKPR